MKILHFYKTYYPDSFGGVEQVIYQLARGSDQMGIEATVLSLTPRRVDRVIAMDGHTAARCHRNFKLASTDFSLSAFWRFKELAKNSDIIHYHFPWPFMDLVHMLTNVQKPSIVTYHSDIVKQKLLLKVYKPLKNRFLESVDAIVGTSPNYFETSDVLQAYKDKVEIIPIGLEKGAYPALNAERSKFWEKKLGNKFFLFIGVLRYYKGLNILLDALFLGDLPMVIVGAGPIELELKVKAAALGLKHIIFLGQVSEEDKVAIIDLSYAVVFPSNMRSEAFGISLLEGAMFGKPMISSEIGTGTTYINIDQETGIVIPPSSPQDLHAAMMFLWNNPVIANRMGFNATLRFSKLFSADTMRQSYLNLYQRVINKKYK